jgi:DNA (cytosine-5)-methyltransferase 1
MKLLYIDLFCGAGGTSTGVNNSRIDGEQCAEVIACVNHDANAIASHAANHPEALHFTEDIRVLELEPLKKHMENKLAQYPDAKVILWASLECTNFSKAKGGQPRDADSRTLAEHLFRYIDALNPDYLQIENVEEFMSWGKMDKAGKPISKDKGKDYRRWVNQVKSCGYDFDFRILNAADFGAYTSRRRFFGILAKKGLPVVFPEATHSKKGSATLQKWNAVKDVLDLDDKGTSIFGRKKDLSEKTLERIYAGLIKFVAGGKDSFLSRYNTCRPKDTCKSLEEPCGVLTTNNRFARVYCSFLSKQFSGHPESKNTSVDGPAGAITTIDHHALVNTKFIQAYYSNGDNISDINSPAPVVTTKDRLALVSAAQFIDMQYSNGHPMSIDAPSGTILTSPKLNLVSCKPWIMNTNFANVGSSIEDPSQVITANRKWNYLMNPQFKNVGGSIDNPCFTLIARMDKMPPYLVSINNVLDMDECPEFLKIDELGNIYIEIYESDSPMMIKIKEFMAIYQITDVLMRMLKILELKPIMGFPKEYVLIGTKAEQKKYIGNAVEVKMARALCECLYVKLLELERSAA